MPSTPNPGWFAQPISGKIGGGSWMGLAQVAIFPLCELGVVGWSWQALNQVHLELDGDGFFELTWCWWIFVKQPLCHSGRVARLPYSSSLFPQRNIVHASGYSAWFSVQSILGVQQYIWRQGHNCAWTSPPLFHCRDPDSAIALGAKTSSYIYIYLYLYLYWVIYSYIQLFFLYINCIYI